MLFYHLSFSEQYYFLFYEMKMWIIKYSKVICTHMDAHAHASKHTCIHTSGKVTKSTWLLLFNTSDISTFLPLRIANEPWQN